MAAAILDVEELPLEVARQVRSYVTKHGLESLSLALQSGHLFDPEMRRGSRRALEHSADHAQDGDAHTLVIQVTPRAKDHGRRIDVRLTSGPVDVVFRAPIERL